MELRIFATLCFIILLWIGISTYTLVGTSAGQLFVSSVMELMPKSPEVHQIATDEMIETLSNQATVEFKDSVTPLNNAQHQMYRGNPERTGRAPSLGPFSSFVRGSQYQLAWKTLKFNNGQYGASKSSPVLYDDRIYFGTDRGSVVCLDAHTGEAIWIYDIPFPAQKGIHASPSVDEHGVYVGAYDGRMYALDRFNGELLYHVKLGEWIGSSPAIFQCPQGICAFVGVELNGPSGYLAGVVVSEREVGRKQWFFEGAKLLNYCHSSPTVDRSSGIVFMGDNSGAMHAWNYGNAMRTGRSKLRNQSPLWSIDLHDQGDVKSTAAVFGSHLFFTSWDGYLYKVSKYTGSIVWRAGTGAKIMSSPSIADGLVITGSHDGYMYAFHMDGGSRKWSTYVGGPIVSSATLMVDAGLGVVGCPSGAVVFEIDTGRIKQKLEMDSPLTGVPLVVDDGRIYAVSKMGRCYLFTTTKRSDEE